MVKEYILALAVILSLQLTMAASADCWLQVRDEPAIGEAMKVYYDNQILEGNLLVIGCKAGKENSWPEVAVLYSSGYLRLKPQATPDNRFGSSFVLGPGYWADGNYYHNPQIKEVKVSKSKISWTIKAENNDFLIDYKIKINPTIEGNTATITEKITAKNDVSLDLNRINLSEAFKIMQISSMYISNITNDANYVSYEDDFGDINQAFLKNEDGLIFSAPVKLNKFLFDLVNIGDETWQSGWIAPSLSVSVNKLKNAAVQGYVAYSANPNNDNVGIWINDNSVQNILEGTRISYSYKLGAY